MESIWKDLVKYLRHFSFVTKTVGWMCYISSDKRHVSNKCHPLIIDTPQKYVDYKHLTII